MGWFALPGTLEDRLTLASTPGSSWETVTVSTPLHLAEGGPRLDRQWEILSISVPWVELIAHSTISFTTNEHLLTSMFQQGWNASLQLSLAVNLKQSGLVVGAVATTTAFARTRQAPVKIGEVLGIYNEYAPGFFSLTDSLQNPVIVRGEESLELEAVCGISIPYTENIPYEYEEGTGESKHTVKAEVNPNTTTWEAEVFFGNVEQAEGKAQPGGVILYINETDKELPQNASTTPTPPVRPAPVPMQANSG